MRKRSPELEARRTSLVALFMLQEEGRSGYEIRRLLEAWRINEYISVSPTTVYRALARLEDDKCVVSSEEKHGNYPTAKIYKITKKGIAEYRRLVQEEADFAGTAYAANIFLGMATYLGRPERATLARNWQKEARKKVEELSRRIEDHSVGATYGKPYPEWLLLDHERHMLEAEIEWMTKFCGMLKARQS